MTMPRGIRVWLGGSFDPVHLAHLQMIAHVYHELMRAFPNVDIIAKLLPTAGSPLKTQPTSNQQRLQMLLLAIDDVPFCRLMRLSCSVSRPSIAFIPWVSLNSVIPMTYWFLSLDKTVLNNLIGGIAALSCFHWPIYGCYPVLHWAAAALAPI